MASSKRQKKDEGKNLTYSSVFDYVDECSLSDVSKACVLGSVNDLTKLIQCGRSVSCCDNQGRTPLHIAAERGNLECCRLLTMHHECDIDAKTFKGTSSLMLAAFSDNIDVINLLLSHGADTSVIDSDGNSCLDKALENDNFEIFKVLLSKTDPNISSFEGWTIAHSIAIKGKSQFLKHLIRIGSCNFSPTEYGITPLHLACQEGNIDCTKLLIEHSSDFINQCANDGITPLFLAAQNGHDEVLEYLLTCGADVNIVTQNGTAVHLAVNSGNERCLESLLKHGADVEGAVGHTDVDTPLSQAVFNNCIILVKILLSYGANILCCSSDPYSSTPLHLSFQCIESEQNSESQEIFKTLIEQSTYENIKDVLTEELVIVFNNSDNCCLLKKVSELSNFSIQILVTREVLATIIEKSRVETLSYLISTNLNLSPIICFEEHLSKYMAMSTAGADHKHFVYQALFDQYLTIHRKVYLSLELQRDPITNNPAKELLMDVLDKNSSQPRPLVDHCRFKIRSMIPYTPDYEQIISSLLINDACKEILLMERNCTVSISFLKKCIKDNLSEDDLHRQYLVM